MYSNIFSHEPFILSKRGLKVYVMNGKVIFLDRIKGKGLIEYGNMSMIEFYTKSSKEKLYTFDTVQFEIDEVGGTSRAVNISRLATNVSRLSRA